MVTLDFFEYAWPCPSAHREEWDLQITYIPSSRGSGQKMGFLFDIIIWVSYGTSWKNTLKVNVCVHMHTRAREGQGTQKITPSPELLMGLSSRRLPLTKQETTTNKGQISYCLPSWDDVQWIQPILFIALKMQKCCMQAKSITQTESCSPA